MKHNLRIAAALAVLAAPYMAANAVAQQGAVQPRTITVSATGEVPARPDVVWISAGVIAEAKSAKDALAQNSAAMSKVIDAIKSAGVKPADVQTTAVNISQRQHSSSRNASEVGFVVQNQVRFSYGDIEGLGEVLDKLVNAGANQMHGISFEVNKPDELLDSARKKAMAVAFRRAGLYAEAAKAELGDVLSIEEAVNGGSSPYVRTRAASSMAVPIEAGSQMLSVTVTVTFALK